MYNVKLRHKFKHLFQFFCSTMLTPLVTLPTPTNHYTFWIATEEILYFVRFIIALSIVYEEISGPMLFNCYWSIINETTERLCRWRGVFCVNNFTNFRKHTVDKYTGSLYFRHYYERLSHWENCVMTVSLAEKGVPNEQYLIDIFVLIELIFNVY